MHPVTKKDTRITVDSIVGDYETFLMPILKRMTSFNLLVVSEVGRCAMTFVFSEAVSTTNQYQRLHYHSFDWLFLEAPTSFSRDLV